MFNLHTKMLNSIYYIDKLSVENFFFNSKIIMMTLKLLKKISSPLNLKINGGNIRLINIYYQMGERVNFTTYTLKALFLLFLFVATEKFY